MEDDTYQYNENMQFLKEKAKALGENATRKWKLMLKTICKIFYKEEIFEDNFHLWDKKKDKVLDVGDRYMKTTRDRKCWRWICG